MSTMPGTIFINYRKDDTRWNALALYNELQKYFEKDQLFKDFNTILPGDDFVVSIENALRKCDVLLVLIGPAWLNMKDDTGRRRLDDPDDFVVLEISTALNRNIQVIPVLIDNTPMPKASELPESMRALYRRQFVEISNTRFEDDVQNLAEAIQKVLPQGSIRVQPTPLKDERQSQSLKTEIPEVTNVSIVRPSNNFVLAMIATILCLPFGVVGLLSAKKVDSLWSSGKYNEAAEESRKAKNWSIYALIAAALLYIIYAVGASK